MTFGYVNLYDGLSLTSLAIGALALASVVSEMIGIGRAGGRESFKLEQPRTGASTALPFTEFFSYWKTILRSSMIGSAVGMLPGLGVTLAAFLSYGTARRSSPNGARFGKGEPEGIIATEAANSAVVGSNLVPTIALGIPGNIAAALLVGALVMHGVVPGPFMLQMHGDLIYGLFASMILANFVHLAIGRLGVNFWVQFAVIPRGIILPPVMMFCIIGVFLPSQSLWDVGVMLVFTGVGLAMIRTGFSIVCLVIGFLLGDLFETSLRQSLLLYNGKYEQMLQAPVALLFLVLTVGVMVRSFVKSRRMRAEELT
ncbi:tripartite tricarboxylate transporter permease [Marinovum algicola]|uniref:tripartite tricarboxylate transporter permease n=2 Tax=Rhodobacterales TaxID=204455 RepID=UPI00352B0659